LIAKGRLALGSEPPCRDPEGFPVFAGVFQKREVGFAISKGDPKIPDLLFRR
jgi:hypothetical protein